ALRTLLLPYRSTSQQGSSLQQPFSKVEFEAAKARAANPAAATKFREEFKRSMNAQAAQLQEQLDKMLELVIVVDRSFRSARLEARLSAVARVLQSINFVNGEDKFARTYPVQDKYPEEISTALVLTHEIGHNLGFMHMQDFTACQCNRSSTGCIMNSYLAPATRTEALGWSSCTLPPGARKPARPGGPACRTHRMHPIPSATSRSVCGNGILEAGEQCDCGPAQTEKATPASIVVLCRYDMQCYADVLVEVLRREDVPAQGQCHLRLGSLLRLGYLHAEAEGPRLQSRRRAVRRAGDLQRGSGEWCPSDDKVADGVDCAAGQAFCATKGSAGPQPPSASGCFFRSQKRRQRMLHQAERHKRLVKALQTYSNQDNDETNENSILRDQVVIGRPRDIPTATSVSLVSGRAWMLSACNVGENRVWPESWVADADDDLISEDAVLVGLVVV
uniref:Peptidase M12B domain-containing protein n=1 Tax=Macrostomum lignano TaxID=282301 RepID=A0A1I8JQW0_9PLAT